MVPFIGEIRCLVEENLRNIWDNGGKREQVWSSSKKGMGGKKKKEKSPLLFIMEKKYLQIIH